MAQETIALVDSYLATEDRWLLRWSLWEAGDKKCYICGDVTYFKTTQIDHVIPKTRRVDFNKEWEKHGGDMDNNGVDHITNLRAICQDCNSSRVKGQKLFNSSVLDLHLQKSTSIMEKAFTVQRRIRRSGDIGESLVKVATADTGDDFDLLWDMDLNQAVMAAFHAGSNRFSNASDQIIPLHVGNRRISLHSNDNSMRLLAAIHLATGVSVFLLLGKAVECAIETANEKAEQYAFTLYHDVQSSNIGTDDWANYTNFSVYVDGLIINMQYATCVVIVELDNDVSLPVAVQSSDGGTLEDDHQTEPIRLKGVVRFNATMRVAHNTTEKFDFDVWEEDSSNLMVT